MENTAFLLGSVRDGVDGTPGFLDAVALATEAKQATRKVVVLVLAGLSVKTA